MSKDNIKRINELLRCVNLRRTKQRVAILGVLVRARRPRTADQIAAKLRTAPADRVTVYRTLETLLEAGIVHKAFLQQRTWHFELASNCTDTQCHPHFTCTRCGATQCFTDVSLPMAKKPTKGFVIDRQRVQLEGLCPRCNPDAA